MFCLPSGRGGADQYYQREEVGKVLPLRMARQEELQSGEEMNVLVGWIMYVSWLLPSQHKDCNINKSDLIDIFLYSYI